MAIRLINFMLHFNLQMIKDGEKGGFTPFGV